MLVETFRRSPLLVRRLALVGAMWVASDAGYYLLLPLLGVRPGYSSQPFALALYYALWVGIALWTFWPLYRSWTPYENRLRTHAIVLACCAAVVLFAVFIMPALPSVVWTEAWDAPELMVATPWYFLPKSIEILFQQLLIVALVFALTAERISVPIIAVCCALLFGAAHVLLGLGGLPFGYVVRFVAAATVFGLVFPYLILRVTNGFVYSYSLHWLYYLVTIVMAHTLSPYVQY
jgi:hypothetical protein